MDNVEVCPFCGSNKVRGVKRNGRTFVNGLDQPIEQHIWYIQCTKCKARGSIASGKVNLYENVMVSEERRKEFPSWQTTDSELFREAASLWNTRVIPWWNEDALC